MTILCEIEAAPPPAGILSSLNPPTPQIFIEHVLQGFSTSARLTFWTGSFGLGWGRGDGPV